MLAAALVAVAGPAAEAELFVAADQAVVGDMSAVGMAVHIQAVVRQTAVL